MLKLCGFAASNYYNKVKLALLEKNVAFEEELAWASMDEAFLAQTPLGKIPFIVTESGALTESEAIFEYIEATYRERPLLPDDPFAASKVRELIQFAELYLEWEARRLYPEAFFGGKVSDEIKTIVEKKLERAVPAFMKLARFTPFALGSEFTLADCALVVHLPLVSNATKKIYGRDFLDYASVKDYLAMMQERETMKVVNEARKVNLALFLTR